MRPTRQRYRPQLIRRNHLLRSSLQLNHSAAGGPDGCRSSTQPDSLSSPIPTPFLKPTEFSKISSGSTRFDRNGARGLSLPPKARISHQHFHLYWSKSGTGFFVMGGWNRISVAGFLKPLAGVCVAVLPGGGAVYFLVGCALGFFAMLHASDYEVGGEWVSAEQWVALFRSVSAHHLFVVMFMLFLATRVWRLGKRCDAVEGLVGNAESTVQALRVRGVVCTVDRSKTPTLKKSSLGPAPERVGSSGCSDKPVARSLDSELQLEADMEDSVNASELNGAEEDNLELLRRRLVRERRLKEAALEELEKERRAAASAADEAMAKIACLRNEKALVEREARQFREMAQQKQMYDRQVIETLQWVINRFGIPCGELELSSDRAMSETSEDDRDKRL